jgi:hypothetical protein
MKENIKKDNQIILLFIANKGVEMMIFLKVIYQKFKNNLDIKIFGKKKNHQLIIELIKFRDKLINLSKVRINLNLSVILQFIIMYLLMILNSI